MSYFYENLENKYQIKDTPFYDFLKWAKENPKFTEFVDLIVANPKNKIKKLVDGPSHTLLLYWLPDYKEQDRLEIDFADSDRPLARSQRERIYYHLIKPRLEED